MVGSCFSRAGVLVAGRGVAGGGAGGGVVQVGVLDGDEHLGEHDFVSCDGSVPELVDAVLSAGIKSFAEPAGRDGVLHRVGERGSR